MNLWETITGLFRRNAKQYLYVAIPPGRVSGGQEDSDALVAGRDYFRIWLTEMSLKRDRDWFSSWHPAVHSLIRFQFGTEVIDLPNIVGERGLPGVDADHLDRSVSLNHAMTSLIPFNGGVVEVTAALLAMQGKDYLKGFIGVLSNFAGLLNVPQLSAALTVAGPVATGIQEVLGGSNGDMHLGLHQSYVHKGGGANELKPGYFVAVLATEANLAPSSLCVVNDRLRVGQDPDHNQPFEGFAYLLFRVQKETIRDDWEGLVSIMGPFEAAIDALGDGAPELADARFRAALAATLKSPDLTQADRRRVSQVLSERFQLAKDGLGAIPTWPSLTADIAAIDVDVALAQGEPDITEFLPRQASAWLPDGL